MKKIRLIFIFSLLVLVSCQKTDPEQEQETGPSFIVQTDGVNLLNYDTRTLIGIGDESNLDLQITNIKETPIRLVIEVVSLSGTDGSSIELCLDACYASISQGKIYPLETSYELAGYSTTTKGLVHILNQDSKAGDFEIDLDLYEVDESNNRLDGGTSLKFTYIHKKE